jgi:predicted transposase/invertase (TIGR01784 family)
MAKKETSRTRKKNIKLKDWGVYIDLKTDFGFKRAFGVKEVMLKFLNSILDIEGGIVDLRYGNPEQLGFSKDERKAVYDLYCITGKDEHVIVEIQSAPQLYFMDRTLVYISRLINKLSEKGKDWDFNLPRIYSINILDFSFEEAAMPLGIEMERVDEKYVSRVKLINCDTGKIFYDKLTFVYIELPHFTKELKDADTPFEQLVYIIRHLHELNEVPEELRNDEVFERLFEIAKIARMTKDEVNNYLKDLNNMNIVKNEIRARDNIIATERNAHAAERNAHQRTRTEMGNALQQANARIAELEQRLNSSQ